MRAAPASADDRQRGAAIGFGGDGRADPFPSIASPTGSSPISAQPVAVIRKNSAEEIRIELSQYNCHDLINIRIWADRRDGGDGRIPTRAGIAAKVTLLPQLIEALRNAEAEARAAGLLP